VVATLDNMTAQEIRPSAMDVQKMIGFDQVQLNGLLDEKPFPLENPEEFYPAFIRSLNNRWGTDDYVDYLLTSRPEYDVLEVPIVWPEDHPDTEKRGKPSWPDGPYGTMEAINRLERSMSTFIWSTQYLCQPSDPKEMIFQKAWIQDFDLMLPEKQFIKTVAAMDLGLSVDKGACFTGCVVVKQHRDGRWYIVDAERGHLDTNGQLDLFFKIAETYKPSEFVMEDVLFQAKMLNVVQRDPRYQHLSEWGTSFYGVHPARGEAKWERIGALQPYFRNGMIYIRKGLDDLVRELLRYRRGTKNPIDLLDALSYIQDLLFPVDFDDTGNKKHEGIDDDGGFTLEQIEAALGVAEAEDDIYVNIAQGEGDGYEFENDNYL
jgi:hypothetical protein